MHARGPTHQPQLGALRSLMVLAHHAQTCVKRARTRLHVRTAPVAYPLRLPWPAAASTCTPRTAASSDRAATCATPRAACRACVVWRLWRMPAAPMTTTEQCSPARPPPHPSLSISVSHCCAVQSVCAQFVATHSVHAQHGCQSLHCVSRMCARAPTASRRGGWDTHTARSAPTCLPTRPTTGANRHMRGAPQPVGMRQRPS